MKKEEKEELKAIRDNCNEKFIELINNTTKKSVRTYCISISTYDDLRCLSRYGKTAEIAEEAKIMYEKTHTKCVDINKFM